MNSKQHLHATGQTSEVEKASLEQVQARLEWLIKRKREEDKGEEIDLQKRLAERAKVEEEERTLKREQRKVKRLAKKMEIKKEKEGVEGGGGEEEDADAIAMARMMGFTGGFGTTKKTG